MVRYLHNHQNSDGGFGLHIEGGSTMFGTALRWGPAEKTHYVVFAVTAVWVGC
jgi:hypothetical protein